MDFKKAISYKNRLEKILKAYSDQTFTSGQHYLKPDQLKQVLNLKDAISNNRILTHSRGLFSVHDMVNPKYYDLAKCLHSMMNHYSNNYRVFDTCA